MDAESKRILLEQLHTIRNLEEISRQLILTDRYDLLPTPLELMLIEIQYVVDENCVVVE